LLAHLTGDLHLVTTVEIDPEVAQQAQQALDTVLGPGVLVHTGNGLEGYVPHAPYDRLIATGSHPFVPLAWLEQLQVGGRLVMNVRGDLGGGFLQVQKVEPGYRARGTFFALPAVQFMALQEDTPAVQGSLPPREYLTWPLLEQSTFTEASFAPALLEDLDFLCFLQWSFPEGRVVWIQHHPTEMFYPYVFDEGERTMVRLEPVGRSGEWQAEVRGRYPLWTSIQHTAQLWLRLGRPAPSDYALEIDAEGRQDIVLPRPTKERVSSLRWNLYPRDHRR
jgi:hypothetical protein